MASSIPRDPLPGLPRASSRLLCIRLVLSDLEKRRPVFLRKGFLRATNGTWDVEGAKDSQNALCCVQSEISHPSPHRGFQDHQPRRLRRLDDGKSDAPLGMVAHRRHHYHCLARLQEAVAGVGSKPPLKVLGCEPHAQLMRLGELSNMRGRSLKRFSWDKLEPGWRSVTQTCMGCSRRSFLSGSPDMSIEGPNCASTNAPSGIGGDLRRYVFPLPHAKNTYIRWTLVL